MKRDMDLLRAILLDVEATPANQHPEDIVVEGHDDAEVAEHVEMLIDGGYLAGKVLESGMGDERIMHYHVSKLTWEGREFLDTVRSDPVWQKTKQTVVEKGGAFTMDILKTLANAYLKTHLGLPL